MGNIKRFKYTRMRKEERRQERDGERLTGKEKGCYVKRANFDTIRRCQRVTV